MGNLSCVQQGSEQTTVQSFNGEAGDHKNKQTRGHRRQQTFSKVHPSEEHDMQMVPWQDSTLSSLSSSNKSDKSRRPQRRESNPLLSSFRSRHSLKLFRRRSTAGGSNSMTSIPNRNQSRSVLMKIDGQLKQKYTIHSIIGGGAFSTVILVEEKLTSTKYALKVIDRKRSFRTNVPWERELDILKRVHHPNIVHLIETHSTTTKVYFVMELASGGDLAQKLSEVGRFKEEKAQPMLHSILDALRYLHKHGVTHRDIKLENCLFKTSREDSPILLSDFGLAHLQPSDNRTGMQTTCGTADYISPEMLEGEVYTDLVDIWAYGVIVYAVLSGSMPFTENTKPRMFTRIREGIYDFEDKVWSDVTDSGKDFIKQLICVDTNKRYSAEDALKHCWMISKAMNTHV